MAGKFAVLLILIVAVLEIQADLPMPLYDEIPLSRSLGYSVKRSVISNLEDERLSRGYRELYREMLKASRESNDRVDEEEARLEREMKGLMDRRRSINSIRSPAGRRRVRSQASRREKLNSQSLRSHQLHIRQAANSVHLDDIEGLQDVD